MNWDGNGNILRDFYPNEDRDSGIKILSSKFENFMSSLSNALENCYTLDSQTAPTSDLNMHSHKIINIVDGEESTDVASYGQITNLQEQIDNMPYYDGYIKGGLISNNTVTPESIIDITGLKARSSDNTKNIVISAGSLNITQSTDWASGSVPTLTDASVFVWGVWANTEDEEEMYFIFDDATGSNITEAKVFIDAFICDGSGDIISFQKKIIDKSIKTIYSSAIGDVPTITSVLTAYDLSIPIGIDITPIIQVKVYGYGDTYITVYNEFSTFNVAHGYIFDNARPQRNSDIIDYLDTNTAQLSLKFTGSGASGQAETFGYIVYR